MDVWWMIKHLTPYFNVWVWTSGTFEDEPQRYIGG